MTKFVYANNADTTLVSGIGPTTTTLQLADTTNWPIPTALNPLMVTLQAADLSKLEIVRATDRVGSVLTVVRAQDGTVGQSFDPADLVEARLTRENMGSFATQDELSTHVTDTANPHAVTAAQAGADPAGSAATVQSNLNTHEADFTNPHNVTAAQAGADPAGSAAGVQSNLDAHEADLANPHAVTAAQAGADPAGSAAGVQSNLDAHEADLTNPHVVTAAQAGADPAGSAAAVQGNLDTHVADTGNPHSVTAAQAGAEPDLGNPAADDYILSSTAAGVRSWVENTGGGGGEANLGANVGTGQGESFRDKTGVTLNFRRLAQGAGIGISQTADTITIENTAGGGGGEANTASNQGAGEGLAMTKSGVDLPFKSLLAGSNITLTPAADTVTIAATGGSGEANTTSNQGAGQGLAMTKSGVDLPFKTLVAGANITLTPTADTLTIESTGGGGGSAQFVWKFDSSTAASNPGSGSFRYNNSNPALVTALYFNEESENGGDLSTILNSMQVGDKFYIQQSDDGTRYGLFTISGAPTDNTGWHTFPVTVDDSDTVPEDGKECGVNLIFSGEAGEANTSSNTGAGAQLAKAKAGVDLPFRSLVAGSTKLSATQNTDDVTLDVVEANIVHQNISGAGTKTHAQIDSELDIKVDSDPTGVTGADQVTNMMSLTQAEYDAIGAPDAATLYLITG